MTRQRIAEGLEILTLRLANANNAAAPGNRHDVPDEFSVQEWAYVLGVASAAILQLRSRLVGVE